MRYEENRLPSDAALVRLYNDAGWVAYTDDLPALRTALENSLYLLCVYEEEELVGLLRAVGDGVSILYIQDILVLADRPPPWHRHGADDPYAQKIRLRAPESPFHGQHAGASRLLQLPGLCSL